MATNSHNIEIGLNSRYNGEGFTKLDNALKGAANGTKSYVGTVNSVLGKLESFDGAVGTITRSVSDFWRAIAGGGVIGAIIAGVSLLIRLFENFAGSIESSAEKMERLQKAHAAYERRLQIYRDAAARREREAEEAAKQAAKDEEERRKAEARRFEASAKGWENGIRYAKAERDIKQELHREELARIKDEIKHLDNLDEEAKRQKIATLELKDALATRIEMAKVALKEAEMNAKAAQDRAKATGDTFGADLAAKQVELARVSLQNTIEDAKRQARSYTEMIKAQQDAREREFEQMVIDDDRKQAEEEERAQKRIEAENKMAEVREKSAKKIKKMEEQIADARKRGAEWEKQATKARSQSAGDWMHQMRNDQKAQQRQQRQADIWRKQAEDELRRYEDIRNPSDNAKQRMDELRQYLNLLDDKNNPNNQANQMEQELAAYRSKVENYLSDIAKAMKNLGL